MKQISHESADRWIDGPQTRETDFISSTADAGGNVLQYENIQLIIWDVPYSPFPITSRMNNLPFVPVVSSCNIHVKLSATVRISVKRNANTLKTLPISYFSFLKVSQVVTFVSSAVHISYWFQQLRLPKRVKKARWNWGELCNFFSFRLRGLCNFLHES